MGSESFHVFHMTINGKERIYRKENGMEWWVCWWIPLCHFLCSLVVDQPFSTYHRSFVICINGLHHLYCLLVKEIIGIEARYRYPVRLEKLWFKSREAIFDSEECRGETITET